MGKSFETKSATINLKNEAEFKDIIKWANVRRGEWDARVDRVEEDRLAKIVRDNRPHGVRSRGRPKKRWKESLNTAPSP